MRNLASILNRIDGMRSTSEVLLANPLIVNNKKKWPAFSELRGCLAIAETDEGVEFSSATFMQKQDGRSLE